MVKVLRYLSMDLTPCTVIVLVDPPLPGYPHGIIVGEGDKGERNNGFVFILTPTDGTQTFKNPAFEP